MREYIEKVPQRIGSSWRYKKIIENAKSFDWHRHEEYEIAIHRNFDGLSLVGNDCGDIRHNHMVLLAPGIPHAFCSHKSTAQNCETHVIWFKKNWVESLINCCSELKPLHLLLTDAQKGIQFSANTSEQVTLLLKNLLLLTPIEQLATLIKIFSALIEGQQKKLLILNNVSHHDNEDHLDNKLRKAEAFLLKNFHMPIKQCHLADHLYMSIIHI